MLTEDEIGDICRKGKPLSMWEEIQPIGKLSTLVIKNPCLDLSYEVNRLAEQGSPVIPKYANSYVISDFNPATQHIKKDQNDAESFYSVYAVKFYRVYKRE